MSRAIFGAVLWLAAGCVTDREEPPLVTGGRDWAPAGAAVDRKAHLARGEYLVQIGACHDCHTPGGLAGTPDLSRALSGSEMGWGGPWGVSYPLNLTPHETGLAAWSEDDIVRALRTGVRPDGSTLLPPMPWPWYAHLSHDDAAAIAAYLKSLPPIDHEEPARLPPGAPLPPGAAVIQFPPPPPWDHPPGT